MQDTKPSDALRRARIDKGYRSASEAARAHGWTVSTYVSHENGTRNVSREAAAKYAKAFGIEARQLIGSDVVTVVEASGVPVTGLSQVGVWMELKLAQNVRQNLPSVHVPSGFAGNGMCFAVQVNDDSMNLQHIFNGEFAVCEQFKDNETLLPGGMYYVERRRGEMVERSLRLADQRNDGLFFVLSSSDPKFQANIFPAAGSATDTVSVLGRVIGRYSQL